MSSPSRAAWQKLKVQLEAPFGKDWVANNFKSDLGPTFDKIYKDVAEYKKLSEEAAKMIAKADALAKSIREQHSGINQITGQYEDMVIAKSKEKKTQHGGQIGGNFQAMKNHYCHPHWTALSNLDKALKSITPITTVAIK